jgi:hypothetical protein
LEVISHGRKGAVAEDERRKRDDEIIRAKT